jgi:hypothetical protein
MAAFHTVSIRNVLIQVLPSFFTNNPIFAPFLFTSYFGLNQSQLFERLTKNIGKIINIHNTEGIYYEIIYFIFLKIFGQTL